MTIPESSEAATLSDSLTPPCCEADVDDEADEDGVVTDEEDDWTLMSGGGIDDGWRPVQSAQSYTAAAAIARSYHTHAAGRFDRRRRVLAPSSVQSRCSSSSLPLLPSRLSRSLSFASSPPPPLPVPSPSPSPLPPSPPSSPWDESIFQQQTLVLQGIQQHLGRERIPLQLHKVTHIHIHTHTHTHTRASNHQATLQRTSD